MHRRLIDPFQARFVSSRILLYSLLGYMRFGIIINPFGINKCHHNSIYSLQAIFVST